MGKTIMIVDDEDDILVLLRLRFEALGYNILVAANGEEAFSLLRKNTPDLILLDLILPGVPGDEICKTIKSDDKLKHIPVIIFTAAAARFS